MSKLGKLLLGVGGVAGLGFGGYYVVQHSEVSKLEKDAKDVADLIAADKRKLDSSSRSLVEEELRIEMLKAAEQASGKTLAEVEEKLKAARAQVLALEKQSAGLLASRKQAVSEIAAALSKAAELRSAAERARESMATGERSLAQARAHVEEARALLNPLNHPKLRALRDSKAGSK